MWNGIKEILHGIYDFWFHDLGSTLRDSDDYVSLPRLLWFVSAAMMVSLLIAVFCGWTTEHMSSITDMLTAAFATGATAYVGKKGADVWHEKIQNTAKSVIDTVLGEDKKEEKENGEV